jgi:Type II secretion system (T2SS), protein M subtype b
MRSNAMRWTRFGVFLAVHGVILMALYAAVVDPALELLADQRRRIEAGTMRLEQASAAAARNDLVAALDPSDVERAAQRFVSGGNDGLRNADLLTRIRRSADEHGVRLTSIATLPPRGWNGRQLVAARIEFTASAEQAAKLLLHIEEGPSLLFIGRARLSAPSEERPDAEGVTASVDIYGVPEWPRV